MTILNFTLLPDALLQFHSLLACLVKFNEAVSIEADEDSLRFSMLNPTKSAYVSVQFDVDQFFDTYEFAGATAPIPPPGAAKFACQIYIRALLSAFKSRITDLRNKNNVVERCEVKLDDDPDETRCRLVVRMICKQGVIKTYKLTYEPINAQHALFDKSQVSNEWLIDSKILREVVDHFGSSAEQLDIHAAGERAVFTSFTTKVANGKEILKLPVHTSVSIDLQDFEMFSTDANMHIAINAKDFKSIISHAHSLHAPVRAQYLRPCRPMLLSYDVGGMLCEFTLMTRGEADAGGGGGDADTLTARGASARPTQQQQAQPARISFSAAANANANGDGNGNGNGNGTQAYPSNTMGNTYPAQTQGPRWTQDPTVQDGTQAQRTAEQPTSTLRMTQRPEPTAPSPVLQPQEDDSLFVPEDDDRLWDEVDFAAEEEDVLGWDAGMNGGHNQETVQDNQGQNGAAPAGMQNPQSREDSVAVPPTQRMSQIRGLFD